MDTQRDYLDYYLAGVFDGEGTIGVYHHSIPEETRTMVTAAIQMCDRSCLEQFVARFGGHIGPARFTNKIPSPHHRPIFGWKLSGKNAEPLLQLVAELSQTSKKQQAILALEAITFLKRARQRARTKGLHPKYRALKLYPAELSRRQEIAEVVSALKRVS